MRWLNNAFGVLCGWRSLLRSRWRNGCRYRFAPSSNAFPCGNELRSSDASSNFAPPKPTSRRSIESWAALHPRPSGSTTEWRTEPSRRAHPSIRPKAPNRTPPPRRHPKRLHPKPAPTLLPPVAHPARASPAHSTWAEASQRASATVRQRSIARTAGRPMPRTAACRMAPERARAA